MIRTFSIVWLIWTIVLFVGCVCPGDREIRYHVTVGLKSKTIRNIFNDRPIKAKARVNETGKFIEIIIHRDDKKGE